MLICGIYNLQILRSSENVSSTAHQSSYHLPLKPPPPHSVDSSSPQSSSSTTSTKSSPPKPPRSAFMCFSSARKMEIMAQQGVLEASILFHLLAITGRQVIHTRFGHSFHLFPSHQENSDFLKLVAKEWKALSDKDRAHWDETARNDKVR